MDTGQGATQRSDETKGNQNTFYWFFGMGMLYIVHIASHKTQHFQTL